MATSTESLLESHVYEVQYERVSVVYPFVHARNQGRMTMMHRPLDILGPRSPVVVVPNMSAHDMLLGAGQAAGIAAGILAERTAAGILVAVRPANALDLYYPVAHSHSLWVQEHMLDLAGTSGRMYGRLAGTGVDSGKN